VDEVHTLIGAGSVSRGNGGGLDVANLFKPALARGELQCIGATTLGELTSQHFCPLTECINQLCIIMGCEGPPADGLATIDQQCRHIVASPSVLAAHDVPMCAAQVSSASMWSVMRPLSVVSSRCTCTSRRPSMC